MRIIFVRRGELSTYNVLFDSLMSVKDVDVLWDRRCGEERRHAWSPLSSIAAERRKEDRRGPPTQDWQLHGYCIVELPDVT